MPAADAVDASVLVAALLGWHESHAAARDALAAAMAREAVIVPVSALIESYSVMTRLPAPHRLRPADAGKVLAESLVPHARLSGLRAQLGWKLLAAMVREGVAGGAAYDRRILEEARAGGASRLLTLNPADFERFGAGDVEIVVPAQAS